MQKHGGYIINKSTRQKKKLQDRKARRNTGGVKKTPEENLGIRAQEPAGGSDCGTLTTTTNKTFQK